MTVNQQNEPLTFTATAATAAAATTAVAAAASLPGSWHRV